jgi:hypothetical protein
MAEYVPLRRRFWDGASRHVLDRCYTQAQQRGCFQGGLGISLGEARDAPCPAEDDENRRLGQASCRSVFGFGGMPLHSAKNWAWVSIGAFAVIELSSYCARRGRPTGAEPAPAYVVIGVAAFDGRTLRWAGSSLLIRTISNPWTSQRYDSGSSRKRWRTETETFESRSSTWTW